jgi:hypothetical protein
MPLFLTNERHRPNNLSCNQRYTLGFSIGLTVIVIRYIALTRLSFNLEIRDFNS